MVIAAAGRGTRLGTSRPKAALKVGRGQKTLLELAIDKFQGMGIEPYCVVSPAVVDCFSTEKGLNANFVLQAVPTGMGDALFEASEAIREADRVLFTWVDQVGLTEETIWETLSALNGERKFTLPCWYPNTGYTGIEWNARGVERVFQRREGESVPSSLPNDVGLFGFTDGLELVRQWGDYRTQALPGAISQEYNFLDFLPWITAMGWGGLPISARMLDTYSINTPLEAGLWDGIEPRTI